MVSHSLRSRRGAISNQAGRGDHGQERGAQRGGSGLIGLRAESLLEPLFLACPGLTTTIFKFRVRYFQSCLFCQHPTTTTTNEMSEEEKEEKQGAHVLRVEERRAGSLGSRNASKVTAASKQQCSTAPSNPLVPRTPSQLREPRVLIIKITNHKRKERSKEEQKTPQRRTTARSLVSRRNQPCAAPLLFPQSTPPKSTSTQPTPISIDLSWTQSRGVLGQGQDKKVKLAGQLLLVVASVKSVLACTTDAQKWAASFSGAAALALHTAHPATLIRPSHTQPQPKPYPINRPVGVPPPNRSQQGKPSR